MELVKNPILLETERQKLLDFGTTPVKTLGDLQARIDAFNEITKRLKPTR